MKKSIIKITIAAVFFTVINFTAFAQNADRKPAIAESDISSAQGKTLITTPAPQIVTAPKAMTITEQPKPIIPGGEFKPMDTNVPVKNYSKTTEPEVVQPPVRPLLQKQQ